MIKIIALITMLIDHMGIILFPRYDFLHGIGRLSFPLFCYSISAGVKHTKNIDNYFIRLATLALISQPIYLYTIGSNLNILFSFSFFVFTISIKKHFNKPNQVIEILLLVFFSIIAELTIDYGAYGIAMIATFYYLEDKIYLKNWLFVIETVCFTITHHALIQLIAVCDVAIFKLKRQIKLNKYFFYIFYPLHLIILALIKMNL